jgi:hypothetical protein
MTTTKGVSMTTETDHEAEARDWLKAAEDIPIHLDSAGNIEALVSQRAALVGIGHALLAVAQELRTGLDVYTDH